jgi:hypothetical protein
MGHSLRSWASYCKHRYAPSMRGTSTPPEPQRHRLLCMLPLHVPLLTRMIAGLGVWVANAKGMLDLLDLRTRKMSCALKGTTGSIRALSLHPRQDVIASVGLDRFLRIHDTKSRCCVAKLYLKQQLTGVAWLPPSLGIPGCWGDTGPAQTDDGVADYGGGKRNPSSRHELPGKPKRTRR